MARQLVTASVIIEWYNMTHAELERARNEIRLARLLSSREENERAESMLRRAASDAQLAAALAREAQAREQAMSQAQTSE